MYNKYNIKIDAYFIDNNETQKIQFVKFNAFATFKKMTNGILKNNTGCWFETS